MFGVYYSKVLNSSMVGTGVHKLDLPEEAAIAYLTRPFTTRLQHRSEFVGSEAKEDHDTLLLGMYRINLDSKYIAVALHIHIADRF